MSDDGQNDPRHTAPASPSPPLHPPQERGGASAQAALTAVADLIREVSVQDRPDLLIRRSQELVLSLLPPGFVVFWKLDQGYWRIVSQVGDLRNPPLQAVMDAGLAYETGWSNRVPWESGEPLYLDAYDPDLEHPLVRAEQVATTVSFPVLVEGSPRGIFGVGLFEQRPWSSNDRMVIETVVQ